MTFHLPCRKVILPLSLFLQLRILVLGILFPTPYPPKRKFFQSKGRVLNAGFKKKLAFFKCPLESWSRGSFWKFRHCREWFFSRRCHPDCWFCIRFSPWTQFHERARSGSRFWYHLNIFWPNLNSQFYKLIFKQSLFCIFIGSERWGFFFCLF